MKQQEEDKDSILNFYKKLIQVRTENKLAAIHGKFTMLFNADKKMLAYKKEKDGEELLVFVNLSEKTISSKKVEKVSKGYTQILTNIDSQQEGKIKPFEARVYKKENK